jgi:hypothetical protein
MRVQRLCVRAVHQGGAHDICSWSDRICSSKVAPVRTATSAAAITIICERRRRETTIALM